MGNSGEMKIGLIGAGRIGGLHARNLTAHPRGASLLIADADASRAEVMAAEIGEEAAQDAGELVRRVDAVVIATPAGAHTDLVALAADAGLPVFCEKPLSLELDDADRAIEAVERAGVPLQVGFHRRFDAGFAEARRLVASDELGRLYAVRLHHQYNSVPPPGFLESSGGLYRDSLGHDFDHLRWTSGQEVEEVYAAGALLMGDDTLTKLGDIDTTEVVLRLTDGAIASASTLLHSRGYDARIELYGSKDSVVSGMDPRTPVRFLDSDFGTGDQPVYAGFMDRFAQAYRDEMDAFISVVRGERESPCTGVDGREALRISLAAMKSLREGQPVRVSEIA